MTMHEPSHHSGTQEGGYGAPDPEAEIPQKTGDEPPPADVPSAEAELDEGNTDGGSARGSSSSGKGGDAAGEDDGGTGPESPDQATRD
jgi:hypothetical protein